MAAATMLCAGCSHGFDILIYNASPNAISVRDKDFKKPTCEVPPSGSALVQTGAGPSGCDLIIEDVATKRTIDVVIDEAYLSKHVIRDCVIAVGILNGPAVSADFAITQLPD